MLRLLLCVALSLVVHLGMAWGLHDLWSVSAVIKASSPMMIQLVDPEPGPVPASPPTSTEPRAEPVKPQRPARVAAAPKRALEPKKSNPQPTNVPSDRQVAMAPTSPERVQTHPVNAGAPSRAIPKPASSEVFSRQPTFLSPPRPPAYPAQARRRNQQGVVLVEVRLDAQGVLREAKLLRSSGVESLDRSALEAVSGWRFRPETRDGQPVPSRVHIPIEFALSASR